MLTMLYKTTDNVNLLTFFILAFRQGFENLNNSNF